jgi:predicted DNA-binding transcriptional regulator YafY
MREGVVRMGLGAKQTLRLVKLVAEMRRNRYPNSETFAKMLCDQSVGGDLDMSCTPRTIQRDIKILQTIYGAPIEFDARMNGFRLTRNTWDFQVPTQNEDLITYSLLGARVLEDIAPEPLKGKVRDTVDEELSTNSSDFLDEAFIESLIIATGIKADVDPAVFKGIFDGWRMRRPVEVLYCSPDGTETERLFEPHIVAFHHGIWYAKGYQLDPCEVRVLAIHRMRSVSLIHDKRFAIDRKLLEETRKNGLFSFRKIEGIVLRCDPDIGFYLREHQKVKKLKITTEPDGRLIVAMPPSVEHDVVRWILGEGGNIEVLEPVSLREKIAECGKRIAAVNKKA